MTANTINQFFKQKETGGLLFSVLVLVPIATFVLIVGIFLGLPTIFTGEIDRDFLLGVIACVGLPALIVSAPAAHFCIKEKRTPTDAVRTCMIAGALAGAAAVGLLFLGILLFNFPSLSSIGEVLAGAFAVLFLMFLVGSPVGFLFSLPFTSLIKTACLHPRSFDRIDWLDMKTGLWLVRIGLFSASPFVLDLLFRMNPSAAQLSLLVVCLLSTLLGAALWAKAKTRIQQKKRWLRTISQDSEEEWQLQPFIKAQDERKEEKLEALRPLFQEDRGPQSTLSPYILIHLVKDENHGPYREGRKYQPVALVYK